jgi:hypothetical protein
MKEVSPKVYKERLLELAKFLRHLPKTRFDYSSWVGNDWKGKKDLSCGTTACALGWATVVPSLRKAGLRMGKIDNTYINAAVYLKGKAPSLDSPEQAGMEVFGLTSDEFDYLFVPDSGVFLEELDLDQEDGPDSSASAKEVAKHIRGFVKAKYGKRNKS